MDRGEYQFVAGDRPCLVGQFQVRDLRFFADVAKRSRSGPDPALPSGCSRRRLSNSAASAHVGQPTRVGVQPDLCKVAHVLEQRQRIMGA
jgi:hypothetical protein